MLEGVAAAEARLRELREDCSCPAAGTKMLPKKARNESQSRSPTSQCRIRVRRDRRVGRENEKDGDGGKTINNSWEAVEEGRFHPV